MPSSGRALPAVHALAGTAIGRSSGGAGIRPVAVMRVAILLLLIGQLGRIPVLSTGTSEAPILVNDLCIAAMLGIALLRGLSARSFVIDSVSGTALLFASLGAISAILAVPRFGLNAMALLVSLAYLARWLVYFSVYPAVVNVVRAGDVDTLWRAIENTILAFAAFGLVQAAFLPHFAQMIYPDSRVYVDWDEQGHRLVSTVLEPNIAGAMIMLVLLVHIARLSAGVKIPLWRPLLLLVALLSTLSRSSLLGLMVGTLLIVAVRGVSRQLLRAVAVVSVAFLAALPRILQFAKGYNKLSIDASALSRVANWLQAIRILADNPWIGVGFNTYGFVQEGYGGLRMGASSYSVDGGLLFIAVMTGAVGLVLYLAMLWLVGRRCRAIWRDDSVSAEWRGLATGTGAATLAVCVQSLFVNSLLTPFVMELLWLMWGLVFVMAASRPRTVVRAPLPQLVACTTVR